MSSHLLAKSWPLKGKDHFLPGGVEVGRASGCRGTDVCGWISLEVVWGAQGLSPVSYKVNYTV